MAEREKVKRRALHRGLDDIINRDASLTSRLLDRVQPASREPLLGTPEGDGVGAARDSAQASSVSGNALKEVSDLEPSEKVSDRAIPKPRRGVEDTIRVVPDVRSRPLRGSQQSNKESEQRQSPVPPAERAGMSSLEEFVDRWGIVLRSGGRVGKLRICEVLYEQTYGVGVDTFFTSYTKLAKLTNLEKKQCSTNIRQLETLGFVERINVFNTATKQGTEFKLHLNPLPPSARRTPRYYCYDEDL